MRVLATLLRGRLAATEEALADRHALLLLDQQLREAGAALARARRALALAAAQEDAEAARMRGAALEAADLEDRARHALAAGREDLATEAAEAIAALEVEQAASRRAQESFRAETARLRRVVADATERLSALDRGRRLARAAEAVRRLHPTARDAAAQATLAEAEATLGRLRARQAEDAAIRDAMDSEAHPASAAEHLAEAGFGPPARPTAASMLARLRAPTAT